MKIRLYHVIGQQRLIRSDFQTFLAQISAVLNSRPLTALSERPDDLEFLSPGHFLGGRPMKQLFGNHVGDTPKNRLRHYEISQRMSQHFWNSWHRDYLNHLQQRPKWRRAQENLKVRDLVLIREDNIAPTFWKTGRIVQTFPDVNNDVRNVELLVAGKKRRAMRPIQKLILLPLEPVEESDSSTGEDVRTSDE